MSATYDRIGIGYDQIRRPDPRLAAQISGALGNARTVVNVGAGAGSYEPSDAQVVAVEPSPVMLTQHHGAWRVQGAAEALPFGDKVFDAAMAIMTIHHWSDLDAGLAEMRRVAERQVVFTWDKHHDQELWIVSEYLPEIRDMEHARFPTLDAVVEELGGATVWEFPIPHDFTDGYQPAFWRRPEAYLDPTVRAASSTFATLPNHVVEPAMRRLRADLASGAWLRRHENLLNQETVDYGFRLVVGDSITPKSGPVQTH
ncbi:MAG: class I SAM-dependent methyltransferase [Acidimicrobiales bacterium]